MRKSFLTLATFLICSLAYAQLSQLEFEEANSKPKPKIKLVPDALVDIKEFPTSIEEAERKEREAMQLLKKQKEKKVETKKITKATYKGLQVYLKGYGIDYSLLPPSLKGPQVNEKSANLIASDIKWPKGKKGSCAQPRNEQGFLKKSESLQEVFKRFSGSNDYYEILNSEICSERCEEGINEPFISSVSFNPEDSARITLRSVDSKCFFQLDKNKESKWKVLNINSIVCSCISKRTLSKR